MYYWDDFAKHGREWKQLPRNPTPGFFAFVSDKEWIQTVAQEMGWLTEDDGNAWEDDGNA